MTTCAVSRSALRERAYGMSVSILMYVYKCGVEVYKETTAL